MVKQFKTIDEINDFIKTNNYNIDSITPIIIRFNKRDDLYIHEYIVVFKAKT